MAEPTRLAFAKQFYALEGSPADTEDLLNYYAEPLPRDGRSEVVVRATHGLTTTLTVGDGPIYAMDDSLPGIVYVVSGTHAYRINLVSPIVITDLGSIGPAQPAATASVPAKIVTIAIGVLAVVICNPPNAYQCLHTASALAQITDTNFPGADSVAYLGGVFAFSLDNEIFTSNLLDAATYDALNFLYADARPNSIQRLITLGDDLFAMGYAATEVLYFAGTPNFPLAPRSGGVIAKGCRNVASICICDQSVFWLGSDGAVYRNRGYQPEEISTFAVKEWILANNEFEAVDALSYPHNGHEYFSLSFTNPTGGTLVYDTKTKWWHRRSTSTDGVGAYRGCRSTSTVIPALIGDRLTGQLFTPDLTSPFEAGVFATGVQVQRRMVLPPIWAKTKKAFMTRLEIELRPNLAALSPIVTLAYSDDGGVTWSSEKQGDTAGVPARRVYWSQLGSFRQRILRFTANDLTEFYAVDAWIDEGRW